MRRWLRWLLGFVPVIAEELEDGYIIFFEEHALITNHANVVSWVHADEAYGAVQKLRTLRDDIGFYAVSEAQREDDALCTHLQAKAAGRAATIRRLLTQIERWENAVTILQLHEEERRRREQANEQLIDLLRTENERLRQQ